MLKKTIIVVSLISMLCGYAVAEDKTQATSVSTLTPRMKEALIVQVSREQYSSNLYMTFASYFADLGLDGCEMFFRHSSQEEAEHAVIFCDLLMDRNENFQMKAVPAVDVMPTSPLDAFTRLMQNEIEVSRSIHNLYKIALEEKDYASEPFLHQFLLLQVQEEKETQDLYQLMKMGANDPAFLLVFDEKLREMMEED